jgi:two-component system alkaline phosphatase synthesis response regulator PhoP
MDHAPRLERNALVVDDDMFMLSALAELLEDDGFDVHTASNGFSAMRVAREQRPTLILLDVALPERSGGDLLNDFRADPATHDAAIVVVSGYADRLSEAQRTEADGIVEKPFDTHELLAVVHRAVQRAASRRAEVAPIAATAHHEPVVRVRRTGSVRRSRGRRS